VTLTDDGALVLHYLDYPPQEGVDSTEVWDAWCVMTQELTEAVAAYRAGDIDKGDHMMTRASNARGFVQVSRARRRRAGA
jgi:hypothetical protein